MLRDRATKNRLSAVWAAYGDALGFITELADEDRVQFRSGLSRVVRTMEWRRKIGGKSGKTVILPPGTYSDDTQLRLSTCRAIRGDGTFNVAAFAKIELPVWLNYALGAGIGSREAAANLARTSATWYSNFFENKRASYVNGGGNGAAMRVQPHVWAAHDLDNMPAILREVTRNAICTHGHPVGIVGACFHALALAHAFTRGCAPSIEECGKIALSLRYLPEVIEKDGDVRMFWQGAWSQKFGNEIDFAFEKSVDELIGALRSLLHIQKSGFPTMYEDAVERLDARKPELRGSAIKTSVLACFAAAHCEPSQPFEMMEVIANSLGSDTDSIGTMAGSIVGVYTHDECKAAIQDRGYIENEALRLAAVAENKSAATFRYADVRSWKPARAAVDAVVNMDGDLILNGLGKIIPQDVPFHSGSEGEKLQWCSLEFGQTVLARIREEPRNISKSDRENFMFDDSPEQSSAAAPRLKDLFSGKIPKVSDQDRQLEKNTSQTYLNDDLQKIINSGFEPSVIGRALLARIDAGEPDFVERGIALTATVLTAYEARMRKKR